MRCWMPRRMRSMWRSAGTDTLRIALTVLLASALAGCQLFRDGPGYDAIDVLDATYTDDEQRRIGMEFERGLREQVRFINDPLVNDFVEELGRSILAVAGRQPFVYRFRIIEDPSLNAFAVFGGYIYLHSGTILAATSLNELAGVVGHEIAHVRMDHHARIQEKTRIPDMLATLAGLNRTEMPGARR